MFVQYILILHNVCCCQYFLISEHFSLRSVIRHDLRLAKCLEITYHTLFKDILGIFSNACPLWDKKFSEPTMTVFSPPVCLSAVTHYGTLPSTKTMGNISEHAVAHSIPTSPSHGSLALYSTFSPPRQQVAPHNPNSPHSEVSSPVFRGDVTLDHRHKTHLAKVEGMTLESDSNTNYNTLLL